MSDTIYRKMAIESIEFGVETLKIALDRIDVTYNEREKFSWGIGLLESYIADMKDLPSAQPHWISCSERLPEEDEDVLLQFSSNMGVGFYRDGWAVNTGEGIYSVVDYSEEKPIAWMPLPKPYGGESE